MTEEYDPIQALEEVVAGAKEADAAQVPLFAIEKILVKTRGLGLPDGQYFLNYTPGNDRPIIDVEEGVGVFYGTNNKYEPKPGDTLVLAVPYDDVEAERENTLDEVRAWLKAVNVSDGTASAFNLRFPKE